MVSGALLVLWAKERKKKARSLTVFSMCWHVSSYMKGLIVNVLEGRATRTTMVKKFQRENEMKVTLTRPFLSWRAAECLICQGNFKRQPSGKYLFLAKANSSHNPPILPPPKETIYNIICIQHFPSALRDYRLCIFTRFLCWFIRVL